MVYWILFIAIIFPWILIVAKFGLMKKIFLFLENIIKSQVDQNGEVHKKMDNFIKILV